MKFNWKKPVLFTGLCLLGILLCYSLFYFLDIVLNGAFVNWFTNHFTLYHYDYNTGIEWYEIDWQALKPLLLELIILFVLLLAGTAALASRIGSRLSRRRMVLQSSRMIHQYMNSDLEASVVFPESYAPLAAEMAEIRSGAQRREQLLKEEADRKNDLITYLAHDLKTPLTSVIGYLSLLNEAPDLPPQQRAKYTGITLEKALRLEKLINEFFEITRYNLHQMVLERETFDLELLLLQLSDEFYPLLSSHGNRISLSVQPGLMVYGDAEKLARVFNNILKNAISYSYSDSIITLRAWSDAASICIECSNRGPEIPAHRLETIFEKFYRLDDARSTSTGGSGLGLAIAREIVTLHGGTISAESRDETTTFRVMLPLPKP